MPAELGFTHDKAIELFKKRHDRPGDVLVDLFNKKGLVVAPGVYNANGAKTARKIYEEQSLLGEPCTYDAIYLGGWAMSAMNRGLPDMGFHNLTDVQLQAGDIIREAHPLPVILDAETGFGTAVTLPRTVETFHNLGVALAHLEDQDSEATRRCGNLAGKTVIDPDIMVDKIKSWLIASKAIDTSMRLMVRTDALTASNGGLEDAIARGKKYMSVEYQGVRPLVLWADAMMEPEEIDRWIEEFHQYDPEIILGINYSPNKDWTGFYRRKHNQEPPTYEDLYRDGKGFRLIWHTILQARADMEATWNTFHNMAINGPRALWDLHDRQKTAGLINPQKMSGADDFADFEKFVGGDEAQKRYDNSQGYKG